MEKKKNSKVSQAARTLSTSKSKSAKSKASATLRKERKDDDE